MRRRIGFTLIELLVVIAIIAILAAILFPVFSRARAKAHQTTCLSNIKQITLSTLMYCDDYDQCGPTRTETSVGISSWNEKLAPYGAPLTNEFGMMGMWTCTAGPYTSYYSMPYNRAGFYMANSGVRWSIEESTSPTSDLLICESGMAYGPSEPMIYATYASAMQPKGYWSAWVYYPKSAGHNDGNNISFFDGHAKWISCGIMESKWAEMSEWRN